MFCVVANAQALVGNVLTLQSAPAIEQNRIEHG
jgi:hypothetical protein